MSDNPKQDLTLEEAMAGLPADFAFFPERFRTQICPALETKEVERLAAVNMQRNFAIGAVAVFIVAGALVQAFGSGWGWPVGGVAGFALWGIGGVALRKLATETKVMLIEPIASQFGMTFQIAPLTPSEINEMKQLGLVGGWDRASYEDRLDGTRGGAPFHFFEAHLEEKRTTTDSKGRTQTTWVTVFRGQCLAVKFMKPFNGVTKVYRDAGVMNMFTGFGQKGQRVKLDDPVFEKSIEVYSSDQVEARYILTPDFMERLLKLEKTFEGRKLRCAFAEGQMLLCVEGKNLFEAGSMYRKMDDMHRVHEMLTDFAAVFLLIDSMSQRLTPEAIRGTVIH
jgi:hypothetical protein